MTRRTSIDKGKTVQGMTETFCYFSRFLYNSFILVQALPKLFQACSKLFQISFKTLKKRFKTLQLSICLRFSKLLWDFSIQLKHLDSFRHISKLIQTRLELFELSWYFVRFFRSKTFWDFFTALFKSPKLSQDFQNLSILFHSCLEISLTCSRLSRTHSDGFKIHFGCSRNQSHAKVDTFVGKQTMSLFCADIHVKRKIRVTLLLFPRSSRIFQTYLDVFKTFSDTLFKTSLRLAQMLFQDFFESI